MDNSRQYWDAMCTPPNEALKKIEKGRLAGKFDINPQWRLRQMTDVFGPIGIGWKYVVTERWKEDGPVGDVAVFVTIDLYVKVGAEWSDPICGIGGAQLIANESRGLHLNDEAYKMATTDALSVAMKQLGVAADVYMGMMDGSKHQESNASHNAKPQADEYRERALAAIEAHRAVLDNPINAEAKDYVDKCVSSGLWRDLYNYLNQGDNNA